MRSTEWFGAIGCRAIFKLEPHESRADDCSTTRPAGRVSYFRYDSVECLTSVSGRAWDRRTGGNI